LTQPQAISGLGGVGKTQTAVEYAYRHRNDYQAVLWVGADTREALVAGFVRIAELLSLPEKAAQDQNLTVAAVARWLENNSGWLLILDNADDPKLAREFLPKGQGHVLLTTRAQATGGMAKRVEIVEMAPEEGALFLFRRTKIFAEDAPLDTASENERARAIAIAQELDGLPLALDQAGAYIEETGCGLSDYLALYRARGAELRRRRGELATDHPDPVATTWDISFKKIEEANPAAAELLRFCAFPHPDAIPEELITAGAAELGPVLGPVASDSFELNAAIGETLKYSLLRRNPEAKTLDIHRLVQAVLKDGMDEGTQHQWAERTVRAVNRVAPDTPDLEPDDWERLLPHTHACADLIERWGIECPEAGRVLSRTGFYLRGLGQYTEAEQLLLRARVIQEKALGSEHPDVANSLTYLAILYRDLGRHPEAEPLFQQALAIWEKVSEPEQRDVAQCLDHLATLYRAQNRYTEAEPLYERALAIRKHILGPEHPHTAFSLNGLAQLYNAQGRHSEAEPLFEQALAIRKKILIPEHPHIAFSLNTLAECYNAQGRYSEAEPLFEQALAIRERTLGPEHSYTAISLNSLAQLYNAQGRYPEAEPLFKRALAIQEKALGPEHPHLAMGLENYAVLLRAIGRQEEAATMEALAQAIRTKAASSQ
jgi:tetratricopeptide (TPR) repeat protein